MTKTKKKSNGNSFLGTLAALIILCVVLTIVSDKFLTYNNLMSVLKQTTFTALLSTGMLLCLITAGIDLSVGANATFCACICGMLVKGGMTNSFVLIVVAIVAGTLIGLINGLLLTRLHLPHPFVSTLGMKNFLWGASLLVVSSQMVSGFPDGVMALGSATIGGFPISFVVVVVIYVLMHVLLTRTSLPLYLLRRRQHGSDSPVRYQCTERSDILLCAVRLHGSSGRHCIYRPFRHLQWCQRDSAV